MKHAGEDKPGYPVLILRNETILDFPLSDPHNAIMGLPSRGRDKGKSLLLSLVFLMKLSSIKLLFKVRGLRLNEAI